LTSGRNAKDKKPLIISEHSFATRCYNIVTTASSKSSGRQQDNAATTNDPVTPTKEVQAEMEKLISTAYCETEKIAKLLEKKEKIKFEKFIDLQATQFQS